MGMSNPEYAEQRHFNAPTSHFGRTPNNSKLIYKFIIFV
jgi:hypothetical protein